MIRVVTRPSAVDREISRFEPRRGLEDTAEITGRHDFQCGGEVLVRFAVDNRSRNNCLWSQLLIRGQLRIANVKRIV